MEKTRSYYWIKKFFFAFRGIFLTIKEEKSMIFHILAALVLIILGAILKIELTSWAIIIIMISSVICIEFVNTAIENLVDMISFKYNFNARKIKDISAAATLVISTGVFLSSMIIFIPRIIYFVQHGYS